MKNHENLNNVAGQKMILSHELFDIDKEEENFWRELEEEDFSNNSVLTKDIAIEIHQKDVMPRMRLWNLFASTITEDIYQPTDNNRIQVLDLACSNCVEGEVLNSFLSGNESYNFRGDTDKVRIYGVDVDEDAIKLATENYKKKDNYSFYQGSATDLNQFPIPREVDVVLLRGQQMFNDQLYQNAGDKIVWSEIIHQGLARMHEGSIFMITSFTQSEHEKLKEFLESENIKIIADRINEYGEQVSQTGGDDRYVLVLKN